MIRRLEIFLKELVLIIDLMAIGIAFVGTYYLRQHIHVFYRLDFFAEHQILESLSTFEKYTWLLFIILPLWVGVLQVMGGYRELRVKSIRRTLWVILASNLLGLLLFGSIVFLLKVEYVSRSFMGLFFLLSVTALGCERAFLIWIWRRLARMDFFMRNVLIVGSGRRARKMIKAIQDHSNWGFRITGVLDDDPKLIGQFVEGVVVIGTVRRISQVLLERVIDEVIFVVPRNWISRIEEAVLECERMGIRATVAVDLFNINFAKTVPTDMDGVPLITFDTTPMDQWQLAFKRTSDILISLVSLMILAPLFLVVAAVIKATSHGPVLFRQARCSLNGRHFTMYKFRSMQVDAEAKQAGLAHLNEAKGPMFKLTQDPRLTPIGRWLRKTSIDELPQLLNVLRGDMSLVGPRPPVPNEVAQYELWQRRRLSMRPGITGNWQVNGRSNVKDFDAWMQLDLDYIDQWSLLLDFKIMLKTIPAVLFGIGAK